MCISASPLDIKALGEHVGPIARAVLPAVGHAVPVLPCVGVTLAAGGNLCLEQHLLLSAAVGVTAKALGHSWSWRAGLGTAPAVGLQAIILSSSCHFNWVLRKLNRVAVKLKREKVMPSGNARCSQGTRF